MELCLDFEKLFNLYGAPIHVEKRILKKSFLDELSLVASDLNIDDWTDPNIGETREKEIRERLMSASAELNETLEAVYDDYYEKGVIVLSFGNQAQDCELDNLKSQLLVILTALGCPFGAFHRKGFWQTLGVNLDAKELRAESVGYIPLHIDFDQASLPPDGVALFCLRPDPLQGGQSVVFDYQRFLDLLSDNDLQMLKDFEYSYSTLFEQNGIGDVYNPHPLLDEIKGQPFFRYNGKVLPELSGQSSAFFGELEDLFYRCSAILPLNAGDLIVVDQNKTFHGRKALAQRTEGQVFAPAQDRFLLQTYLRHRPL